MLLPIRPRKSTRLSAALAVMALGIGVAAPSTPVHAAFDAFAYQVFDCTTSGTDFGVVLGTPDSPTGLVPDTNLIAEALGADSTVVRRLNIHPINEYHTDTHLATVDPQVNFAKVRFTWTHNGRRVSRLSPAVQAENCGLGTSVSTQPRNPGPGLRGVTPKRLLDTRAAGSRVAALSVTRVVVNGRANVPANATAAMLNVTAVQPAAAGFLTVYPCGVSTPTTSSVNFIANETRAGPVFTKVGTDGAICVYASTSTDIVVDVNGYVANSSNPIALTPIRVVDTRPGYRTDVAGTPKGLQTAMEVPVSKFGVAKATNLIVNVTTVGAVAPGHITLGGCINDGEPLPAPVSSLVNFSPGRAQANLTMAYPAHGRLCVAASTPTHIIVDLVGSTSGATPLVGAPPTNSRLLDTRFGEVTSDHRFEGIGTLTPNRPLKLEVRNRLQATGTTAAAFNITVANPSAPGHLTVYPCGSVPLASNINFVPGVTIANLAYSNLDESGNVCLVSSTAVDLVVDLAAFDTTTIGRFASLSFQSDEWEWDNRILLGSGQTGTFRYTTELVGGHPPYTISGPKLQSYTASISPAGELVGSGDGSAYVIAEATYHLQDSTGRRQAVPVSLILDPQYDWILSQITGE